MEHIGLTFRQALRRLSRARLFAVSAALTLAVGIAACTLMTSVVTTLLVKPLPYPTPDRLTMIWSRYPNFNLGFPEQPTHGRAFTIMRENIQAFSAVAAFRGSAFNLGDASSPERLSGAEVTGDFFRTLGVAPAIGRFFDRANELPGNDRVVVISDGLWRRRYAGLRDVVGRVVQLNDLPYVVVGVAPRGFAFPRGAEMPTDFQFPPKPDAWIPMRPPTAGPSDLAVVGRLRPGATLVDASHDMTRTLRAIQQAFPTGQVKFDFMTVSLRDQAIGHVEPMVLSLLGAVALLLVLSCVNAAQLVLARLHARRRETALRAAIGASRRRIASEIVAEIAVLTTGGAALGVGLGVAGITVLRTAATQLPRADELSFDSRSAVAALGVIVLTMALAAVLPVLVGTRVNAIELLRGGRGQSDDAAALRLRSALIASQIAGSVALVACAGLLARSLFRQLREDRGFAAAHRLTFEISLPASRYPETQQRTAMLHPASVGFLQQALANLRAIPGVEAAAFGKPLPLSGSSEGSSFTPDAGAAVTLDAGQTPVAQYTVASPGMLRALGVPLLSGRDFDESDREDTAPVVIINDAMAEWLWPNQSAIGKRLRLGGAAMSPPPRWMTVVGVVANIKRYSLTEAPKPEMLVPHTQDPYPTFNPMQFVVRSRLDAAALTPSLRRAIASVDPSVPIAQVRTIDDLVRESSANVRAMTNVTIGFAAAALLLAVVGTFGVMGYAVQLRRRELGVRRALGAGSSEIVGLVLRQVWRVTLTGVAAGFVLSAAGGWLVRSLLFEVKPFDPVSVIGAACAITIAAVAASAPAVMTAARVAPRVALEE